MKRVFRELSESHEASSNASPFERGAGVMWGRGRSTPTDTESGCTVTQRSSLYRRCFTLMRFPLTVRNGKRIWYDTFWLRLGAGGAILTSPEPPGAVLACPRRSATTAFSIRAPLMVSEPSPLLLEALKAAARFAFPRSPFYDGSTSWPVARMAHRKA